MTNIAADNEAKIYDEIGLPDWAQRWQVPWENVILEDKVLGRGNFGVVLFGFVTIDGGLRTNAAFKILKGEARSHVEFRARRYWTTRNDYRLTRHRLLISEVRASVTKLVWAQLFNFFSTHCETGRQNIP